MGALGCRLRWGLHWLQGVGGSQRGEQLLSRGALLRLCPPSGTLGVPVSRCTFSALKEFLLGSVPLPVRLFPWVTWGERLLSAPDPSHCVCGVCLCVCARTQPDHLLFLGLFPLPALSP